MIKVYHSNYKDKCLAFINGDDKIIVSNGDKEYLGTGIYFWDNFRQAIFWKDNKKNNDDESIIISAEINLLNMMDLSDTIMLDKLERMSNLVIKRLQIKTSKNKQMGVILDILFESFNKCLSECDVIKGQYIKQKSNNEHPFLFNSHFTSTVTDIYCVRNPLIITNRKEEDDE